MVIVYSYVSLPEGNCYSGFLQKFPSKSQMWSWENPGVSLRRIIHHDQAQAQY